MVKELMEPTTGMEHQHFDHQQETAMMTTQVQLVQHSPQEQRWGLAQQLHQVLLLAPQQLV